MPDRDTTPPTQEHPGSAGVTTGQSRTGSSPAGNPTGDTGGGDGGGGSASRARDAVMETGREVMDTGRGEASEVKEEITSQTSRLLDDAGTETRERADTRIRELAGHLGRMSEDLGTMAARSPHPDSYATALARDSASMAGDLSERLQSGGLDTLTGEVTGFARRRPGMFLAGAFAVGLGLGRLSKNADLRRLASQASGGNGDGKGDADRSGDGSRSRAPTGRPLHAGRDAGTTGSDRPDASLGMGG